MTAHAPAHHATAAGGSFVARRAVVVGTVFAEWAEVAVA
jgi:hypothetical protein